MASNKDFKFDFSSIFNLTNWFILSNQCKYLNCEIHLFMEKDGEVSILIKVNCITLIHAIIPIIDNPSS